MKDDNNKPIAVSGRERRLRESLASLDEEVVLGEKRIHRKAAVRRQKITKKINKARQRYEARLNRRAASKIYSKAPIIYYILTPFFAIGCFFRVIYYKILGRVEHHRLTTPHRSFYVTTRAQSIRQIAISGYFRFCGEVFHFIWDNKRFYLKFIAIVAVILLIAIGSSSIENYQSVRDALKETNLGFLPSIAGSFTQAMISATAITDANLSVLTGVVVVIVWLTLVYAARQMYAGKRNLKLRDALYNAPVAFISILLLLLLMAIQTVPLAISMAIYVSVSGAGFINQGIQIENMAAWMALFLIGVLTIYWMSTSLISLITITIPGIYPMRAYFETSVLLSGRRVKVFLRLLMMLFILVLMWIIGILPFVVLDVWLNLKFPLVQFVTSVVIALSLVWASAYMYILYRRLIDSPDYSSVISKGWINLFREKWQKIFKKKKVKQSARSN